jgi:hypothetical protein
MLVLVTGISVRMLNGRGWQEAAQQLPEVLTSYFYFYVRFRAAIAVVDGGDIFGIWRVGEEIWVHFFWAKGLGVS